MTISSERAKNIWGGDGVTTRWDFQFRADSADHIVVVLTDPSGVETELPSNHYAVAGVGAQTGGSITYPLSGPPLADGWNITLLRRVPAVQDTDLANQSALHLETIERMVDRVVMMVQGMKEELGRAVKAGVADVITPDQVLGELNAAAAAAAVAAGQAGSSASDAGLAAAAAVTARDRAEDAAIAAEASAGMRLSFVGLRYDPATDSIVLRQDDGPGSLSPQPDETWTLLPPTAQMALGADTALTLRFNV